MNKTTRSHWRRALLFVLAWVAVGFTINAAMVVAIQTWGTALKSEPRASRSPDKFSVTYARGFGKQVATRNAPTTVAGRTPAPSWVALDIRDQNDVQVVSQFAVGWPFPSCTGWWRADMANRRAGGSLVVPHRMMVFTSTQFLPGGREAQIPMVPMWYGLIANTAILGSPALLLLLISPVRASRRRRKGKCPRCAYDLKHDFASWCSECGWNKPPVDASAA